MRILYSKDGTALNIGRCREHRATQVISNLYPEDGYSVHLFVRRPGDVASYPAAEVELDPANRTIIWTVTDTDTDRPGRGEIQYRYQNAAGTVVKTKIYKIHISEAIDVETAETPDPYETWVESLIEQATQTGINAIAACDAADRAAESEAAAAESERSAGRSAEAAEESETNAARSETNAAESEANAAVSANAAQAALAGMAFVAFAVQPDGHVYISNSDLLGTTSFELLNNGHLEVTY